MSTISRLLASVLVVLFLSGCANRYVVSQEELQNTLDQRLPLTGQLAAPAAGGTVSADSVQIDVGRSLPGKVAITARGQVALPTALGQLRDDYHCTLSGALRFEPEDGGIYLAEVAVDSLEFTGLSRLLPPQWYEAATREAARLIVTQLTAGPIYTVEDRSFSEKWFRQHGSAIEVEEGRLVFRLDRQSGP